MPVITIKITIGSEDISVTRDQAEIDDNFTYEVPTIVGGNSVEEEVIAPPMVGGAEGIIAEDFSIPPVPGEEDDIFETALSVPPPPEE